MRLGIIGRFKPPHLGTSNMLRELCTMAEEVYIGIGSSNRYNARNPFTAIETREMIDLILQYYKNYHILEIPDMDNGPEWAGLVYKTMGSLDYFVSGNDYVIDLLKDRFYQILHPLALPVVGMDIRSTKVRISMARGECWEFLVPRAVSEYIKVNNLDKRFILEFGEETLKTVSLNYLR